MARFSGVVVALVTPFRSDGSLDLDSFKWLVEGLEGSGIHGLWVAGTTGEWTSISPEERGRLFQAAVEASGRAKVFAGVAGLRFGEVVEAARMAGDAGVDYVFSTPPLYFKPDRVRLLEYYERIGDASGRPVYIYTIPSNVGYNIPVEDIEWMAMEYSGIAGIKATLNDYTYLGDLVRRVKASRSDFTILSGTEELLLHNLAVGGDGSVSALANILPGLPLEVWRAWEEKDLAKAAGATRDVLDARGIVSSLGAPLPLAIKSLLARLGAPIQPVVRPPLGGSIDSSRVAAVLCRRFREYIHPNISCAVDDAFRFQYL